MIAWDDAGYWFGPRDGVEKIAEDAKVILERYERQQELNERMFSGMGKLIDSGFNDLFFMYAVLSLCKRIEKMDKGEVLKQ